MVLQEEPLVDGIFRENVGSEKQHFLEIPFTFPYVSIVLVDFKIEPKQLNQSKQAPPGRKNTASRGS